MDMRDLVLYLKRRCFCRPKECAGCELYGKDGRCFFDHQAYIYKDSQEQQLLQMLHPAHWELGYLKEEGWDGDGIKV